MVRPSNPRLMARVLDAVMNLGDTKGSSAREVLSFIRQSNVSPKNLTVQVHRALKHAVNAGLLRHRSGRYKALATLNPASGPTPSANKESTSGDRKTEEKKSKSDGQTPIGDAESSSRRTQEHNDDSESARTKTRSSRTSHPDGISCTKGTTSRPYHSIAKRNVREYPSESSSPTFPTRAIPKAMWTGSVSPDMSRRINRCVENRDAKRRGQNRGVDRRRELVVRSCNEPCKRDSIRSRKLETIGSNVTRIADLWSAARRVRKRTRRKTSRSLASRMTATAAAL